jgi:squalene monooxygenase
MALRAAAKRAAGVDLIEATATGLIEEEGRVVGVKATKKIQEEELKEEYRAGLVVFADGCFSNFRNAVMGRASAKPSTKSHFCGAILEDVVLPMPNCGTVALIKGSGPVLMYQISERDTRILIDVKIPLPADLKVLHISLRYSQSIDISLTDAYSDTHCPSTPLIAPTRHRNSSRKGPFTTHAQLFPSTSVPSHFRN